MKVENGKFYFIKDEFFDIFEGYRLMENKENGTSINVIKLAKKGINIPFYDILEMKNVLLKN